MYKCKTGSLLIVALAFLIIPFTNIAGFAQDAAKGKTILNKVSKKYKQYKNFKADFKQTLFLGKSNKSESENSTLYVKGNAFRLDTKDQNIYCDGTTMWSYLKDDNQVSISNFNSATLGFNPAEIFTIYEKGFSYAYMGDEKIAGKNYNLVELTPTDKSKNFYKVKMFIDPANSLVKQVELFEKNGNRTTISVTNFESNLNLGAGTFTFSKSAHPNVEVIDYRK